MFNTKLLELMTDVLGAATQMRPTPGTPAAMAWSVVAFSARNAFVQDDDEIAGLITGVDDDTALADVVEFLTGPLSADSFDGKTPAHALAEACSNQRVFDVVEQLVDLGTSVMASNVDCMSRDRMRLLILDLVRASLSSGLVPYGPEVIMTTHAVASAALTYWKWVDNDSQIDEDPVMARLLSDNQVLRPCLLEEAQSRCPYEPVPFLKFSSALTRGQSVGQDQIPAAARLLLQANTFMQRLPEHFSDYRSIREEENLNYVELEVDLPLFAPSAMAASGIVRDSLTSFGWNDSDGLLVVPRNTVGNIVDDRERPYIAVWNHRHNGIHYLIKLLSTFMTGAGHVDYATLEPISHGTAAEVIGFIADLLQSSLQSSRRNGHAEVSAELLDALEIGADRPMDTAVIVLSIFEQELLRQCQQPGNEASLEVLVNCTHFIHALISVAPARAWSHLSRTRLFETDGNGGSLASVLVGTEMPLGRYDFLIGCIRIFQALVEDAVEQCVARRGTTKALVRFGAAPTSSRGGSDKILGNTLLSFGESLLSIFLSSTSWKYARMEDKLEVNIGLAQAFTSILRYAYGADDASAVPDKLIGIIAPVADSIIAQFSSGAEIDLPINPILATLLSAMERDQVSILTRKMELRKRQTRAMLAFANTVINVARLKAAPWTHLERQLFKAAPMLVRLYAADDAYKSPVVILFGSLVRGASRIELSAAGSHDSSSEPPSLLGYLGPQAAKNFLSVLSLLDKPLGIIDVETNVWNLLTAVVSCKQQWLALYLLTGKTPRESVKNQAAQASGPSRSRALLLHALEQLAVVDLARPRRSVAMLEFVFQAQNNWSWAMSELRNNTRFLTGLQTFLAGLRATDLKNEAETVQRSWEHRIAALICEILAMHLHTSRQDGNGTQLKDILPALTYLEQFGLAIPPYNASLHANLRRNLTARFRVSPDSFRRSPLCTADFGRDYFYDADLADKMLHFDASWKGQRQNGFYDEFVRANINLGLVESQVILLQSWRILVIELSSCGRDETPIRLLVNVVQQCMEANAESTLPQALFGRLMSLRADLAFTILQKMVRMESKHVEGASSLLMPIWNAIRSGVADFESVFASKQADYYRSLIKVLFLALYFHTSPATQSTESQRKTFGGTTVRFSDELFGASLPDTLLEVLSEVVAKGFRSLATLLHDDDGSASSASADFGLITAILQTVLRVPEMQMRENQVSLLFANSNTARYATSLFSWADKLAVSGPSKSNGMVREHDPVYGQISLVFLVALSSIPMMAESLAVDGVLAQLSTANLMHLFTRPDGTGPFAPPAPRLFAIWAKGILPLCLNLLSNVGAAIAGEIAAFLNQFGPQLLRAVNALDPHSNTVASGLAKGHVVRITPALAAEAHSLTLLAAMLDAFRVQGAAFGVLTDVARLEAWDADAVRDHLDAWLSVPGRLADCIVGDVGEALPAGAVAEKCVIAELEAAAAVLGRGVRSAGAE